MGRLPSAGPARLAGTGGFSGQEAGSQGGLDRQSAARGAGSTAGALGRSGTHRGPSGIRSGSGRRRVSGSAG
eukprot:14975420-Heterocapsa_arctica.AAC.1